MAQQRAGNADHFRATDGLHGVTVRRVAVQQAEHAEHIAFAEIA